MNLIAVIGIELAVIIVAGFWFMVVFALRPWLHDPVSRHLMALAAVGAFEALTLLLALIGVPLPMWLFAVGYGLIDVVVIHRLVLLYWARRSQIPPPPG